MSDKKIGFIGSGNMGSAMIGGIIKSKIASRNDILVFDKSEAASKKVKTKYKITVFESAEEVAKQSDVIFIAVKPHIVSSVISKIRNDLKDGAIVVSIAAGQSISVLEKAFEKKVKLVRAMPNTPALVGEGMTAISSNSEVDDSDLDFVIKIFESFGKAEIVPEKLMDVVTAISGSSPAYVYMFIEALADAGVRGGMPRDKAYIFAAQAVLGSAKMVLETGAHPGELKDNVCSPGGTTIEAVAELEKNGFRNAVIAAAEACRKKSENLSK